MAIFKYFRDRDQPQSTPNHPLVMRAPGIAEKPPLHTRGLLFDDTVHSFHLEDLGGMGRACLARTNNWSR